ncbi:MAG: HAMP domain-containing histidine kinase [Clostridiaceae bacterium]|nr:HAMP domain-containing histidine kinase [Clostridiaceae bacterium]
MKSKFVRTDKEKIEIVLNNLINNAIKYTSDNKIQINLKNVEDRVFFSIQNGIANYDPKIIEKIWEPFYVIESSRDKKLSGTGLGLSIVRAILQKHNIEYGFNLNENQIEFYIFFEESCK